MPVFKQPNGKWRAIVQDGPGRRKSKVCATLREAKRAEAMLMIELGKQPDNAGSTLEDLIDLHLHTGKARAATTTEDYDYLLAKMPQWMKDWKVTNITAMMLDQSYHRLEAEGWTVHRIRRLHGIIRPALDVATKYGWITHNPALSIKPPAAPESTVTAPSPEDVIAMLTETDRRDPSLGCALRLTAMTGLRRGELCGLQWQDFNEDDAQLVIRRSVSTTKADARGIGSTKTGRKGWRVVALPKTAVTALVSHRRRQAAWLLSKGLGQTMWVFTLDGSDPWRTDYVTGQFTDIRDALGIDLHLHQLRHYVATQLIGSGVDLKTVSGRLGHSRVGTTSDIYAAFMPARDREAADIMERSLGG